MAITEIYVDPAINGNSGTGTIGDPFGDLQHAFNTVTRNSTDGDRFNIKSGTAEIVSAPISLTTYGTPTSGAPLWIHGYTSAAGDGGFGELSAAGANSSIISGTFSYAYLKNLKIGNTGTADILSITGVGVTIEKCEIHHGGRAVNAGASVITNCYVHDIKGTAFPNSGGGAQMIQFSTIWMNDSSGSGSRYAISNNYSIRNLIVIDVAEITALYSVYIAQSCVIVHRASAALNGVTPSIGAGITNNIIVGFSGGGGRGVYSSVVCTIANNIFYNNATHYAIVAGDPTTFSTVQNNSELETNPFVDSANGDFRLTDAAKAVAIGGGMTLGVLTTGSPFTVNPYAFDIGVGQSTLDDCAGGGGPVVGSRVVRGLGAI